MVVVMHYIYRMCWQDGTNRSGTRLGPLSPIIVISGSASTQLSFLQTSNFRTFTTCQLKWSNPSWHKRKHLPWFSSNLLKVFGLPQSRFRNNPQIKAVDGRSSFDESKCLEVGSDRWKSRIIYNVSRDHDVGSVFSGEFFGQESPQILRLDWWEKPGIVQLLFTGHIQCSGERRSGPVLCL